ncbi:MAG: hypothetical protein H6581_18845 [Bacteroidia bacterium]|nr:hypothetical protein [Bacteroidia bacterium]
MDLLTFTQAGFVLLSLVCIAAIFLLLKRGIRLREPASQKKILLIFWVALIIWLALLSALSLSGFLSRFDTLPPRMPLVILPPLLVAIFFFRSKLAGEVADEVPPAWVMYLQGFRVPVELLLWALFLANALPQRLTFEGTNWDVITGLTGPLFALVCFSRGKIRRGMAIAWNILGLILLLNIVTTAVLSFPTPFQVFNDAPGNTIMTTFPCILLPGLLVPLAYYLHILSLKQMVRVGRG